MAADHDEHKKPPPAPDPALIARQLRMMAAAEAPYTRFTFLSATIKNIWNVAATLIENNHTQ